MLKNSGVRGLLAVLGVAVGVATAVLVLRGPSTPSILVPGPCEVRRTLSPTDVPMPDDRTEYSYDADGRVVLEQQVLGDQPRDSTRRGYDAAGHLVLEERFTPGPIIHTDSHGTTRTLDQQLSRLRWTYDADGRMLTRELEREGDGVVQHATRYAYDEAGTRVSAHAEWDGEYASDTTFEYDAAGRLVAERSDGGAPSLLRYEHDADGHVIRETTDIMADGTIDRTVTRELDASGRVLVETTDDGFAGARVARFTYDDAGNVLTRRERFGLGEGEVPMELLETYDHRCWAVRDGRAVDQRPPRPE